MADLGTMKAKVVLEAIELGDVNFDLKIIDNKTESSVTISGALRLLPHLIWALTTGEITVGTAEANKCETEF